MVSSNLEPILHRFRDTAAQMSKIENFPFTTAILAKIGVFPLEEIRDVGVCTLQRGKVRLISNEIIFQEFQPV